MNLVLPFIGSIFIHAIIIVLLSVPIEKYTFKQTGFEDKISFSIKSTQIMPSTSVNGKRVKNTVPSKRSKVASVLPTNKIPLVKIKATYPWIARKRGYQGIVHFNLWVNAHGRVDKVIQTKSSGHNILDNAAKEALRELIFPKGESFKTAYSVEFNLD